MNCTRAWMRIALKYGKNGRVQVFNSGVKIYWSLFSENRQKDDFALCFLEDTILPLKGIQFHGKYNYRGLESVLARYIHFRGRGAFRLTLQGALDHAIKTDPHSRPHSMACISSLPQICLLWRTIWQIFSKERRSDAANPHSEPPWSLLKTKGSSGQW